MLTVGTYNLGASAVHRHPEAVLSDLKSLMKQCHVLGVQEAGGADKILARLEDETGVKIFHGFGAVGQASTPIIYRSTLKVKRKKSWPLTGAVYVGDKGAGPSRLKPKWLNSIKFKVDGKAFWFSNIHTTPSIYIDVRKQIAETQMERAVTHLSRRFGVKILVGDFNSQPDDSIRNILEHGDLRSSQGQSEQDTLRNRSIDDVYYSDDVSRIRKVSDRVVPGASDHHAYVVDFEV